jgi:hypothetical protein
MAWYSTGTVNVTNGSAALVGVGTAWLDAVQQGWAFYGPDGRPYQVLTVNSNTSITLAKNYTGTTLTGQAYDLIPTQGFVRTLAQRVSDLIATYAGFVTTRLAGLFGAGSVSAPGVAREGDTNTGIYWPADDEVAVATGGVQRVRVDSAGRVGIGGSPTTNRLEVYHATNGIGFRLRNTNTNVELAARTDADTAGIDAGNATGGMTFSINTTERLRIGAAGNVGIGTASPSARLHIDTTTSGSGLIVGQLNQTGSQVNIGIGFRTAGLPFLGTNTASNPLEIGTRSAASVVFVSDDIERMRIDAAGNWLLRNPPSTPPALATNGDLTLNPTSNTNVRISYRGSDGVTRVGDIPLA